MMIASRGKPEYMSSCKISCLASQKSLNMDDPQWRPRMLTVLYIRNVYCDIPLLRFDGMRG